MTQMFLGEFQQIRQEDTFQYQQRAYTWVQNLFLLESCFVFLDLGPFYPTKDDPWRVCVHEISFQYLIRSKRKNADVVEVLCINFVATPRANLSRNEMILLSINYR